MKNVLITGGAGFVGSELGKFLLSNGCNVKILDNLEYGYRDNFDDNPTLAENFIQADVRDADFAKHLGNIDIVYHFAGISALPECESNPTKAMEVNTTAVANVLNACRNSNVKKVVFASTSALYENNVCDVPFTEETDVKPNLIYSMSKHCAEKVCRSYAENYDMDITICRFFNVFGAHQDFKRKYPPFTSYIIREALAEIEPTIFNTTDVKRDYIYVDDLCEFLNRMRTTDKRFKAEVFNLASGKGYSAIELAEKVYDVLGAEFKYNTAETKSFWDKYEDLFDKKYNLSKDRVEKEVFKHCIGDNSKIVKEFDYIPKKDLKEGLKEIVKYQQSVK